MSRDLRYKMDEPGKLPTILIVEDDPDLRLVHSEILSHEGYAVLTAADGVEALELVENEGPPAMILLDLRMPRMNGWDLAKRLRQQPRLARHSPRRGGGALSHRRGGGCDRGASLAP